MYGAGFVQVLWSLVSRWSKEIRQFDSPVETMAYDDLYGLIALYRDNIAEPMPFGNMVVSWNRGTPKPSIYRWIFPNKPTIVGYPHLWQPPYVNQNRNTFSLPQIVLSRLRGFGQRPCWAGSDASEDWGDGPAGSWPEVGWKMGHRVAMHIVYIFIL